MFVRMTRWFSLAVLALAGSAISMACSSGAAEDTELGQLQQAQRLTVCACTDPKGGPTKVTCEVADSCFKGVEVECGSAKLPCSEVCQFPRMSAKPGVACEAVSADNNPYKGRCATEGVGPGDRAGCCPDCVLPLKGDAGLRCGGLADRTACGQPGNDCRPCADKDPNDCFVPACEKGKCTEQSAPAGYDCVTAKNEAGHCTAQGVCCPGCLTPKGTCLKGSEPGACGTAGAACVNCDNGLACDGKEQCEAGKCSAGTPLKCDDGNSCTNDSCDDAEGCQFEVEAGKSCNDGDGCTTEDTCDSDGACSGAPITCDDGNDCTVDTCDAGACSFTPVDDNTECDDGSSCTDATTCQSGVCVSDTAGVTCHAQSNPCVTSSCGDDGTGECMEVNRPDETPCDDGNPCTTGDACQAGACVGAGSTDCDDNNPCTSDSCDDTTGCSYENITGECADGDLCTTNDRCRDGECSGDAVECAGVNECQGAGSCDTESGLCSVLVQPDGTACGDGGECLDGSCDGETIPMEGEGGMAGDTGVPSAAGGAAGESGIGGSAGADAQGGTGGTSTGGTAGTYTGDAFTREPKGCDCRSAPGSSHPGHASLAFLGFFAATLARTRRKKRAAR